MMQWPRPREVFRRSVYRAAMAVDGFVVPEVAEAQAILASGDMADLAAMQKMRNAAFINLVRHCYSNVPYYRRLMDERELRPASVQSIDDLTRFPVLTRSDVRRAGDTLLAKNIPATACTIRRSGGTTGEPIAISVDRRARGLETYALLRGHHWMGWQPGLRKVNLFGGSLGRPDRESVRSKLREYACGGLLLPAFQVRRDTIEDYLQAIAAAGPCVLNGYASALLNLALLASERRRRKLQIAAVFYTAEMMPLEWRRRIEDVFNAPALSYYGCGEVNSLGFQVAPGGPHWVPDEHVVLESAESVDEADSTGSGGLLVTTLFNYSQPLIRYSNDDAVRLVPPGISHQSRTCIGELHGRMSDMFLRADGTRVSSSLGPHLVYRTALPVNRYQFIQHALDQVEFRYEPTGAAVPRSALDEVAGIIKMHLGDNVRVECRQTDDFVISPAGKHRIMVVDRSLAPS